MKRTHLLPLLIWTLLWGLFFSTLLLAVERLPNSDFSGQFHAFGLFQAREIGAGRLPIWSPGSYGGVPFAADTQAAVFYPPRVLSILLSLPGGFSYYVLELEGLLHIWLTGLFTYFLAFSIVRNPSTYNSIWRDESNGGRMWMPTSAHWAALLAAVGFGLGGYLTSYPLLQLAVLESVTWLPLVLWLLRCGVRVDGQGGEQSRWQIPALIVAGAMLGLSALAGHPQTFLHITYLAAVYFLFLTWQAGWRWTWIIGLGAMVMVIAVGVAMPMLLPAFRFLPYTVRSEISYEFLSEGFSLLDYVQVLIPGPLSLWLPQYAGLVTLFLTVLAWIGRRSWPSIRQRAETLFWIVIVLIAAWLSLGDKGILFELIYRLAPGFSLVRQQERLVSVVSLGMVLLGAQGLALWLRVTEEDRRQWLRKAGMIIAGGLLLVGLIFLLTRTVNNQNDWLILWLRQWLILFVLLLILWPYKFVLRHTWKSWRGLLIVALLFLDLIMPLRQAMNLEEETPAVFWPEPGWLEPLQSVTNGRLDSQGLFHTNLGEVYGLQDIRGISPLKPQFLADFEKLERPRRWQLLNVQHVLAPKRLEDNLTEIAVIEQSILPEEERDGFIYQFEEALPRAWMVYEPIINANREEAFTTLRMDDFDPASQVVLTNPDPAVVDGLAMPDSRPEVVVTPRAGSGLEIVVDTQSPGILVISEWALPGWKATMDGENVPLLTANYALLGLVVPPGEHEITLSYVSMEVRLGVIIALVTLVLAVVVAWRWQPTIPVRPRRIEDPRGRQLPENGSALDLPIAWIGSHWLLLGMILLGFGLRIYLLGNQELRGDEAFSYLFAELPLAGVVPELIDQGDPHSPLHYLMLNAWVDLAGISEFAMRYLSLLPGVLLLPLIYRLGRAMAGKRVALLATLLTAISPSLIWLSQDVRNQYTLAILCSTAATLVLEIVTRPVRQREKTQRLIMWVLYIVLAALAVYAHYYALFALLSQGLFLWFSPGRRRFLLTWILSGAAVFLCFLPWLTVVWTGLVAAGQLSDPSNPELTGHLVDVGRELLTGATIRGPWTRWLFLAAFIFVVIGTADLRNKKPGWAAMLGGWLGGAALLIFLVRFSRGTFNEFYISVAAPAWLLLLSTGLTAWQKRGGWRRITSLLLLAAILTAMLFSLRNNYFDLSFSRTLGYRKMAAYVAERAEPGDLFITHFPDPSLDYYLRDVPMPRQMNPQAAGLSDAEVEQNLADLFEVTDRAWFVPYNNSVWDRENVVPRWLDYHMLHEQYVQLDRMTLQAFRPKRTSSEVTVPISSAVGDEIVLDSAYITLDGQPVDLEGGRLSAPGGSTLRVSLLWLAQQATNKDYAVFVHLLDENGALVAQHDGIPLFGTRPTYTWEEGEQLLDRYELVLPGEVSGSGRLIAGLYDTQTLERLEIAPGQEVILLADVEFK
ncbi:MAG: glycosyltransferase family 39 protein [Candidatus Promineifilaceae bacterium]|nr:glycosyltransferase family 39 protein [Candidatus Promineifilaceae bacterium]